MASDGCHERCYDEWNGYAAYFGTGMAQAGKSGTTTLNRDALFAGFTPYYTCVVWGGYDDNSIQSARDIQKNLWKAVMKRIHADLKAKDFEKPSGIHRLLSVQNRTSAGSGCL